MKSTKLLLLMAMIFAIVNCKNTSSDKINKEEPLAQHQEFYQLKIYTFDTREQVQITDKYLKEAYLPGLKRLGLMNIGVFKTRPNDADTTKMTYVLIPFKSIEQFLNLDKELARDQTYLAAGDDYINASHDKP
ncbi:MAG: hypothetical protein J7L04_14225, partial [Bacteroidales bacterium]|nr:hypothetical protein [Bacteroidales bacterium]